MQPQAEQAEHRAADQGKEKVFTVFSAPQELMMHQNRQNRLTCRTPGSPEQGGGDLNEEESGFSDRFRATVDTRSRVGSQLPAPRWRRAAACLRREKRSSAEAAKPSNMFSQIRCLLAGAAGGFNPPPPAQLLRLEEAPPPQRQQSRPVKLEAPAHEAPLSHLCKSDSSSSSGERLIESSLISPEGAVGGASSSERSVWLRESGREENSRS